MKYPDRKLGRYRKGVQPILPSNTFRSKYENYCPYCKKTIRVGDIIRMISKTAVHDKCLWDKK